MKITKHQLRGILRETIIKENFGAKWNTAKAKVLKELEENDGMPSGQWQNPANIIAFYVEDFADEQDQAHFIEEVIEEFNASPHAQEAGGIDEDIYADVFDVMDAQSRADYESRREDEATNPW